MVLCNNCTFTEWMCFKYHCSYQQPGCPSANFPYSVSCQLLRQLGFSGFQRHLIKLKAQLWLQLTGQCRNWSVCITFKGKISALNSLGNSGRFARWWDHLLAQPSCSPRISLIAGTVQVIWTDLFLAGKEEFQVLKLLTLQIKWCHWPI